MTAPGDSVLIFILLALFVACSAYAAGRLHQRYQTARDREEAYRDGYETASSRVFSLAARTLVPKRAARGVAAEPAAAARTGGSTEAGAGHAPSEGSAAAVARDLPAGGKALLRDATPGSSSGGISTGGTATEGGPGVSTPSAGLAGTASAVPAGSSTAPSSAAGSPVGAGSAVPSAPVGSAAASPSAGLAAASPASSAAASPSAGSLVGAAPASTQGPTVPATSQPAKPAASSGFPLPPPPPRHAVSEPAAVGGVTYQPFPDPRPAGGLGPMLGRRPGDSSPAESPLRTEPAAHHPVTEPAEEPTEPVHPVEEPSTGKHTVPDELVNAATYRLPPDRIFRARVPNGTPLPEEPTTPLSVPKPRRS